jgi:hypothetical protein
VSVSFSKMPVAKMPVGYPAPLVDATQKSNIAFWQHPGYPSSMPGLPGSTGASPVALTIHHFAADASLRGSAAEVGIRMPLRGERGLEAVRCNVGHPAMQDPQRLERRKANATRGLRTICWGSSKTLPQAPFCAETRRGPGHGGCGVVFGLRLLCAGSATGSLAENEPQFAPRNIA